MTFFESLLALLLAAIVLLQVARRLGLPYPAMLALAGATVAFLPGAPTIALEPHTMLALFIAPVLLDAAYDFPLGSAKRLWRPLAMLAVGAVLLAVAACLPGLLVQDTYRMAFFASGALVPILPYLFGASGLLAVLLAAGLVGLALLASGAVVGLLSGAPMMLRALRQLLIGYGAAAITYVLGLLFNAAGI